MNKALLFTLLLASLLVPAVAHSWDGHFITGDLSGTAVPINLDLPTDDLAPDGRPGRSVDLRLYDAGRFVKATAVVDSNTDFTQGDCAAGQVDLRVAGHVVFEDKRGNSLISHVVESQHLCLFADGRCSDELVGLDVVGGSGAYEGRTGTGWISLPCDRVLRDVSNTLWPDPAIDFPLVVHVPRYPAPGEHSHFELAID